MLPCLGWKVCKMNWGAVKDERQWLAELNDLCILILFYIWRFDDTEQERLILFLWLVCLHLHLLLITCLRYHAKPWSELPICMKKKIFAFMNQSIYKTWHWPVSRTLGIPGTLPSLSKNSLRSANVQTSNLRCIWDVHCLYIKLWIMACFNLPSPLLSIFMSSWYLSSRCQLCSSCKALSADTFNKRNQNKIT